MDLNKVKDDLYDTWKILSTGSTTSVSHAMRVIIHCKDVIRVLDPDNVEDICEELNVAIDTFQKILHQKIKETKDGGYDVISESIHIKSTREDWLTTLEVECSDIILKHAVKNSWFLK